MQNQFDQSEGGIHYNNRKNKLVELRTNQLALWISPRSEHCAYESRRPSFSCAREGAFCNSAGCSAELGIPAIAR